MMTTADLAAVEARYRERTPRSAALFEATHPVVPGGTPGGLAFQRPYPLFIERGEGCHVWDVDGNRYVDMLIGDWLLPHGHAHPAVTAAITAQLAGGTTYAAPGGDLGLRFADLLRSRMPSIERVRFATSGTEATMSALRLARTFTGRPKLAKMRGGYHGTHDMSLLANYRYADPDFVPPGLAPGTVENTVLLPFNDLEGTTRLLERHGSELAAVIVEPMLGGSGMVPGSPEYLHGLREVTSRLGIVLIFDEVVTFSLGPGGAQGWYGIRPDLTTLGKAVGGGLPLAAFGGRAEIMDLLDPVLHPGGAPMRHATTLGGIPITLAAGIAQIELMTPAFHDHLDALGERLRAGVGDVGRRLGLPLQATGAGPFFAIHWTSTPVVDFDTALTSDRATTSALVIALQNEGYLVFFSNCAGVLSGPMSVDEVDGFLAAIERGLSHLGLRGADRS